MLLAQFDPKFSFPDNCCTVLPTRRCALLCGYTCAMLCFQNDDIGDVFQDEENMAALLVHRDAKNGGLLVVSILFNSFTPCFERETICILLLLVRRVICFITDRLTNCSHV
jgi:hypothetical protein